MLVSISETVTKARYKTSWGEWITELAEDWWNKAIAHKIDPYDSSKTLCGYRITTEDKGWFRHDANCVTCQKCLKKMEKE